MKVLLLGPAMSGKSSLANFLAEAKENPASEYRPTVGCRILELQLEPSNPNSNSAKQDVQLWDCSSDPEYQNFWPALAHEAHAVLLLHDVTKEEHIGQLASIYTGWSRFLDLPSSRYLIVGRKWGDERTVNKKPKTGPLAKLPSVDWNMDLEGAKVRTGFAAFVASVLIEANRKQEEDEITMMTE